MVLDGLAAAFIVGSVFLARKQTGRERIRGPRKKLENNEGREAIH